MKDPADRMVSRIRILIEESPDVVVRLATLVVGGISIDAEGVASWMRGLIVGLAQK